MKRNSDILYFLQIYGEYCIINLNTYVRVKLKQNISTYEHMLMNIYESGEYIAKKPIFKQHKYND